MKRRDLERRLRMAGCCAQTQRNQGTPGPEDPRQPRRELSLRPTATVVELVASRRVLGGISTTPPAAPGCFCLCANTANRTAAPAPPPNRSCAWGLPPTKATKASGSCSLTSGDSLAAGAGDPGGVVTGDGVGGLNSQHLSRFVHPSSSSEPSRILRARLRWLANSTNSACSSAEVSKPG